MLESFCVTVVMPVHNAMPWLNATIESIREQTHSNFQLAIYDDCSTDGSYEAALAWADKDSRITIARGDRRLGPVGSSNAAANLANTEFVARMDADDLMMPDRLERQLQEFLDVPETVMVGSASEVIDCQGRRLYTQPLTLESATSPFLHPTMMYRRSAFNNVGQYVCGSEYMEDDELFVRLLRFGRVVGIARPLVKYRLAGQNHRLTDSRESVIGQLLSSAHAAESPDHGRHAALGVFSSLATMSVMGNSRPAILRAMIRRIPFNFAPKTLAAFGYVAVSEVSPAVARWIWVVMQSRRNSNYLPTNDSLVWNP